MDVIIEANVLTTIYRYLNKNIESERLRRELKTFGHNHSKHEAFRFTSKTEGGWKDLAQVG